MNELRRMAYLSAMGIDSYVSRAQLPGAAVTRRLAIVPAPAAAKERVDAPDASSEDAAPVSATASPQRLDGVVRLDFGLSARDKSPVGEPAREALPSSQPVPRFTLSTILAGDWLWLEELGDMPLTTEQVQLVQSMALALARSMGGNKLGAAEAGQAAKADVAQFDWPLHTNRQLDLGADAARTSVAAFVSRRLEQHRCRGLVLLGWPGLQRVPLSEMNILSVSTASSAEILANPALKRQVWRDLQPLLGNA